ncbi:MAG: leucine-rich repeat domain-containing protein [Candidatus Paceibacterota bacterium]
MGHLSSLRRLYLGYNQLTSLPPQIGHISSLRHLNLNSNQLTSLPSQIDRLVN